MGSPKDGLWTIRGWWWCFSQNLDQSNCIRFSDWFLRLLCYCTTTLVYTKLKNDVRSSLLLFCDMNLKTTVKPHFLLPRSKNMHPFCYLSITPHNFRIRIPSCNHYGIKKKTMTIVKCQAMTLELTIRESLNEL